MTPAGIDDSVSVEDITISTEDRQATYQLDAVVLYTKSGRSLVKQSHLTKDRNHFELVVWPDSAKNPQLLWHFDDLTHRGTRIDESDYDDWISIVQKLGHLFIWSRVGKPVKKAESNSQAMSDA